MLIQLNLSKATKDLLDRTFAGYCFLWNYLLSEYTKEDKLWKEGLTKVRPTRSYQHFYECLMALRDNDLNIGGLSTTVLQKVCHNLARELQLKKSIGYPEEITNLKSLEVLGRKNIYVKDGNIRFPKDTSYVECNPKVELNNNVYGYVVHRDSIGHYSIELLTSAPPPEIRNNVSMTTIAVSAGQLAADTQLTKGRGMIMPAPFIKIHFPEEGKEYWEANGVKITAFALCGQAKAVDYIKENLRKGIDYKSRVSHDDELEFQALLVTEKHNVFVWSVYANKEKRGEEQFLLPVDPPVAAGSGMAFAMAAMCVGKDAKGAIKTAAKLDAFTGGDITVFDFPPIPEVPSVRPAHLVVKAKEEVSDKKVPADVQEGKAGAAA